MAPTALTTRRRRDRGEQGGFTLIELMIALTVMLIGVSGILSIQLVSARASSYSRHATEAAILAEDGMELLRTVPVETLVSGSQTVNASGAVDATGMYTRSWTISWIDNIGTLIVTVSWLEQGADQYQITYRTQRVR
ncbi:MAG TPA: prepilin-type N-terminal cleavage/methylation domain-containing protein [Kofleriaceae bacterium]|nr:prepilin-type N-terminal cleavage/methylation domain-containing protein [Kofleriaceae bacterium]